MKKLVLILSVLVSTSAFAQRSSDPAGRLGPGSGGGGDRGGGCRPGMPGCGGGGMDRGGDRNGGGGSGRGGDWHPNPPPPPPPTERREDPAHRLGPGSDEGRFHPAPPPPRSSDPAHRLDPGSGRGDGWRPNPPPRRYPPSRPYPPDRSYPRPMPPSDYYGSRCQTFSNGYVFTNDNPDVNYARWDVVRVCKEHPYTSNNECEWNLQCTSGSGYPPPPNYRERWRCSTFSNRQPVTIVDYTRERAERTAMQVCSNRWGASREECWRNMRCEPTR